jgi:hypothetical protein
MGLYLYLDVEKPTINMLAKIDEMAGYELENL